MNHPVRRFTASRVLIVLLAAVPLPLSGCEDPAGQLELYAAQAKTSRAGAGANLVVAFKAEQITADDAITLAHQKLDAGEDATAFAGAVLDMLLAVEDKLPQGGEFELFWMRVGQLAFRAALTAYNHHRPDEAMTLVFAGPRRWQTDAYWQKSQNHDALASIILSDNGRRSEAIARLQGRPDLDGPALEMYEKLTGRR